jgi:hypothetical protein
MRTDYFDSLIDDFGIWQHTDGQAILYDEGYALDDAARGLIACLSLQKLEQADVLFRYIFLSFHYNGFYGFATKDRKFIKYPASEDAVGQVMWAMGYAYSLNFHKSESKTLFDKLIPVVSAFHHFRGFAYALLGAVYINQKLSLKLAGKLKWYFRNCQKQWLWPESTMTYGNGIIPYAFLRYAIVAKDPDMAQFGLQVLEFVQAKCTDHRLLGPIGNDKWLSEKADKAPNYSQQPIDSAYMIWAWVATYQYFHKTEYLNKAKLWMEWFKGKNIKHLPMYDSRSLMCYDGIDETSIHYHSGAEANICILLSINILNTLNSI